MFRPTDGIDDNFAPSPLLLRQFIFGSSKYEVEIGTLRVNIMYMYEKIGIPAHAVDARILIYE